ncbi:uncharacterized protein [Halyomorpha halys]|uniref:uncharacterized protein n=1 Tax=Halyomorpha halys TaxID=286706 RepID=UPI0006D4F61D|nr:uncharacterized protein LOC106680484 [Halyomorpha halys]
MPQKHGHNPGLYSQLQGAQMDFWRRCLRITRLDRVRNEDIMSRLGVTKGVPERIGRSRLQWQWYGHCQWMPECRWPKRLLQWEQPGRRRKGRPRTQWKDCAEEMAGRGLEEKDWWDREKWRDNLT